MVKAAEVLNLNPQPKPDAKFPRCWWAEEGYVIIDKLGSKEETLRKISEKISEFRGKG
jgi:signal recognition particle subunit SEC65